MPGLLKHTCQPGVDVRGLWCEGARSLRQEQRLVNVFLIYAENEAIQQGKEEDATETSGSDQENKEDAVVPDDVAMKTNTVNDMESNSDYFKLWNLTHLAANLDNDRCCQVSGSTGK